MSVKLQFLFLISLILTSCFSSDDKTVVNDSNTKATKLYQHDWHGVIDPTEGVKPQVYGSYTAGCVDGAVELEESGAGYRVINMLNNRRYGHPSLVNMINDLGKIMLNDGGRVILVGDLGHPRGGPASIETSAHRSHQTGLDVDIWFRNISPKDRVKEALYPTSVLARNNKSLSKKNWNDSHMKILEKAAGFNDVERILVNPYAKKAMCENYKGAKWLNKLRPWWGHDKHFHVRLKCPDGDKYCKSQVPVPNDDGCGEVLDWWFSEEAAAMGKKKKEEKRVYPKLPTQCEGVWEWEKVVNIAVEKN